MNRKALPSIHEELVYREVLGTGGSRGSLYDGGRGLPDHVDLLTVTDILGVTPAEEREVVTLASVASFHVLSLIWSVASASISVLNKMGKMDGMKVTY